MQDQFVVHPSYESSRAVIENSISDFEKHSEILGDAERNVIKVVTLNSQKYAIKSFKVPNVINQVIYRFFRKSKAERSYRYANRLLGLGIRTPAPMAYLLELHWLSLKKSYYVSGVVDCDLTFRELTTDFTIPDHEAILRAFTRFTHTLHEKGVLFLDHSPGNTLIKRTQEGYEFYLVDLNRMEFKTLDFEMRMQNFSKLTIHKWMIEIMSNEYAKHSDYNEEEIFSTIWKNTRAFQHRYYRKIRMKKRFLFWKKKYKDRIDTSPI